MPLAILFIGISILLSLFFYNMLENGKVVLVFICKFILFLIVNLISGYFAELYNYGFLILIIGLVILFINVLISTYIENKVAFNTNSFLPFLIISGILEAVFLFLLKLIITLIVTAIL